ncbi:MULTISPECIES: hypothetical protein [unclassified Variovorax]|uniref:hypothetical protein n=1 Tax=unclassified Variovorax TaxID=663243 RepID=UPI000838BC9A|nr:MULTISPECIES: hypothetical protein [unclassified Variovorax]PNG50104.1 hypothetical protein CHC06_05727 [Variovorax sp. B2]PNG50976.1 hypothetical protein CHC07_05632 [Variovorax sp. B4]VTU41845.1 hypothetical protein SRS16P1_00141 [Variovorax sp. SRS16]VTU41885.1 hypothetical protein E5P1_00141 [Variovorax sp. PBL-E5]VTU44571.1 hypothetical protein H6P1_00793 [Variovorax sp. PBL-H6]
MNFKELMELARFRPVAVECLPLAEDWEAYPERGMRMHVTGGTVQHDDVGKLQVDFTAFEEFNRPLESANYNGPGGKPITAREYGDYKVIDTVYVDPTQDISGYVQLLDGGAQVLLAEFSALPTPRPSYVSWLEARLVELRQRPAS